MGINHMTGTPWHVERMHRKEGDSRRNKRRCIYYDEGECRNVRVPLVKCSGSAHCMKYRETLTYNNTEKTTFIKSQITTYKVKPKKMFL